MSWKKIENQNLVVRGNAKVSLYKPCVIFRHVATESWTQVKAEHAKASQGRVKACQGKPRPATAYQGKPRPTTACQGKPRPATACQGKPLHAKANHCFQSALLARRNPLNVTLERSTPLARATDCRSPSMSAALFSSVVC